MTDDDLEGIARRLKHGGNDMLERVVDDARALLAEVHRLRGREHDRDRRSAVAALALAAVVMRLDSKAQPQYAAEYAEAAMALADALLARLAATPPDGAR